MVYWRQQINENTMISLKKIFAAYCFLLLLCTNATAKQQLDDFELGRDKFNQGQYELALTYFNRALSQGNTSPKLLYALGSVHYKLKNYKASWKYFEKTTKIKQFAPLSYYNLGLIAHKVDDDKLALKYFKRSKSITNSKNLKNLTSKQISTLTSSKYNPWGGYASAGYGNDSNITSAPSGVASNESGSFVRATALVNYIVTGSRSNGLIAKATIFANDYLDTSFNDDKSFAMDISLRDTVEQWKLAYEAGIKQSTYGDDDFQRTYKFTFKAKNKFPNKNELRLRYRYEDINSLVTRFDYLEGSRQKLRAEYRIKWSGDMLRLQYELELNDRQNTVTRNYSPTRHKLAVKYDNKLDPANSIGGEVEYRASDYDATATQDRSDDRVSAAIKHTYSFDDKWKLKTRIKYKTNDSNEPGDIFDYDRTIATIDLSRRF